MAKAKEYRFPTLFDFRPHAVLLHPMFIFVAVTVVMVAAAIGLWHENKDQLLNRDDYLLTSQNLQVTPQPEWIRADIKRFAFDGSQLSAVNLLDVDAVKKVAAAFQVQPWVNQVSVRKNHQGMIVDVAYRRPVALVEFGNNLLLPVDGSGVVLDGREFNDQLADDFLRLTIDSPFIGSLVHGEIWPDDRVIAAAMIAQQIADDASRWGIVRVRHVPDQPGSQTATGGFELLTKKGNDGIKFYWGNPPGFEVEGEASADIKTAALSDWLQQLGPLDSVDAESRMIDLRRGRPQP